MAKSAQAIKLEQRAVAIAACRDASGSVTPRAVLEAARDPSSVLHDEFEWNVAQAAEREWLRTAGDLIRSVKFIVEYEDRKIVAPYYVSDPRQDGSAYITTTRVAKSAALSERVLRDEMTRITGAIHRAMALASAFGLVSNFERMLSQVAEIETRLDDRGDGDEARV